jgi:membrane-bound lytic murein transglycosylase D
MNRRNLRRLSVLALLPAAAACGAGHRKVAQPAAPNPVIASVVDGAGASSQPHSSFLPIADPVLTLIAESDGHFKSGQRELELGHVAGAKLEFDRAINVLLESPYGGRTEPRIREHFDRLVDRISSYEVKALAEGDGFTEKKYEPASIDELLAMSATLVPDAPTPGLTDAVQSDLQSGAHDIPIPLNERVLAFIELFQGRLHNFLEEGMRRGSQYLPMIQNVFRAEGLPLDLAYVPLVESAFKPNALSRANAKGVWQFMRGTGVENGLRQDWYIDERSDPEKATVAAAKYLRTLARLFDGGPGRLQRAVKATQVDDFWSLAAKQKVLPRETRDYVPMILAAIVIARNPAQYGFDFELEAPHQYDTVTLPRPVDLRRVAEWTDTTIDQIQTLNPELRRWTTPVNDAAYELKVPIGTAGTVKARLDETASPDLASLNWYVAKKGETLTTIARKLRVSRTDLADANALPPTTVVTIGQKLMVPHEATVLMGARTDRPVPVADSRALVADRVVPAVTSTASDRVQVFYEVKRGDTLASIARVFRTTVASLQTWNRILGDQIQAGQKLTIYTVRAN